MDHLVQKAVRDLLVAASGVTDLVAQRVYDNVPRTAALPYLTIGDDQLLDVSDGNGRRAEIFATVNAWAEGPDRVEVKQVASAVVDALEADLTITGWRCKVATHVTTRYPREPDGVTARAIIEFRYQLERI